MSLFMRAAAVSVLLATGWRAAPSTAQVAVEMPAEMPVVDEETSRTIDGALRFLASRQRDDGSFSDGGHRAAITAYVLHTFLTAGHLPDEGPYAKLIESGTAYLLACARPDGYIAAPQGEANMYGHGIAAVVLGELYGQSRDERLRPALERAIRLIIAAQHETGGWRYQPQPVDHDVSATVLQLVALRVAKNSGLEVPQEVLDRGVAYIRGRFVEAEGGFGYQHPHDPGFGRTAAAIYSLQVCGVYDDPMIDAGARFLFERFDRDNQWFTYGSFYAAPAMLMRGGDDWPRWYAMVRQESLARVIREGDLAYWRPRDGDQGGVSDVYSTAVFASILALPYGYLPLYQR